MNTHYRPSYWQVLVLAGMALLTFFFSSKSHIASDLVYLDPALASVPGDDLVSVVVTAVSSETAASAIQSVDGQVTSNLWLINAAGGLIHASDITHMSALPGIVSIVKNHGITSSDGPPGNGGGNGNGNGGNDSGYVTSRRVGKGAFALPEKQLTPVVPLPDGGFVSINEKGGLLIVDADGGERATLKLSAGSPFYTAPVVGQDGTIYLSGEGKRAYAISAQGTILWTFQDGLEKFKSGVILSPDETIVYVVDEKRSIYALDSATGTQLWRFQPAGDGNVLARPTMAADGTLYLVTEKGYLYAVRPNGTAVWNYQASHGDPYKQPPLVSETGLIFIAGEDKTVVAVDAATGQMAYHFQADSKILAQPAVDAFGNLYVAAEDRTLYSVAPDGTIRFTFRPSAGKFTTSPVLSPDGSIVFVAVEEQMLYAVDTSSGASLWQYATAGKISSPPAVDGSGNLLIASEGFDLAILNKFGQPVYRTNFAAEITQPPVVDADNNAMLLVGDNSLVMLGMLPDEWDGRPDVIATDDKYEYALVNPVSIDVGADIVVEGMSADGAATGEGVTIAIVDSGVYFSHEVKQILGTQVQKDFLGQADFISPVCETILINKTKRETIGTQYSDYCFHDYHQSKDSYGHGSHVAGIIWNDFADANTSVNMGIAPDAKILSVRVLGDDGNGTYEDVIRGLQYVIDNKDKFNIRVVNMSLSGIATTPYFVNPLNRAVEAAWAHGLVVVAAAGNQGNEDQTISVPGNDPYVITVGAINSNRTPGYWGDDFIPTWSSAGPTQDGFVKPDVLAPGSNIVSFMYNDPEDMNNSAYLVQQHPDYSANTNLFRMNGTSMATAVASGAVALMLDVDPNLTPDQVKFRLMASAKPMITGDGSFAQSILQQGMGRIWAPDAVFWDDEIPALSANQGMDIEADLANPWLPGDDPDPATNPSLAYHYMGPVQYTVSDDGATGLYFTQNPENGRRLMLGAVDIASGDWLDYDTVTGRSATSQQGDWVWNNEMIWAGGYMYVNAGGYMYVGADDFGWMAPGGYMYVGADGYMYVSAGGYMYVGAGGYMYVNAGGYMYVGAGGYMYVGAGGYMYVGAGGYMYVGADNFQSWASNNPGLAAQTIATNNWVDD